METEEIIQQLKQSNLWAESPCGHEFQLSKAILFDGTKTFPKEALESKQAFIDELTNREEDLIKQKKLVTKKAEITSKAINIGKNLEKILPTLKDFKWELPDCRFIGDPLDLITFNGLSINKIDSISFIEIKSGAARLNDHQKMIKDAIGDKKISYKEFK
ncbi:MAG: Holliday junction resolvase-like protein [Nanoarchaeota archaeon]